jgi:DNA polymerase elongation subunit (family B)
MKTLLIDIETAPNISMTWGMFNQNIALNQLVEPGYTLCFAAKWKGKKKPVFRSVWHHSREEMLTKAHELLSEADAVVHYNGVKFDIPVLNGEFLADGYMPPPPPYNIDLFKTVKRNFRLTSMKMDFVANHLGIEGKLPHKGMSLWWGCMRESWREMKAYNLQDIHMLEPIYDRLLPWIKDHPNMAHYSKSGRVVCPSCASERVTKRGTYRTQTMVYQRFQCQACGSWSKERTSNLTKTQREKILAKV